MSISEFCSQLYKESLKYELYLGQIPRFRFLNINSWESLIWFDNYN